MAKAKKVVRRNVENKNEAKGEKEKLEHVDGRLEQGETQAPPQGDKLQTATSECGVLHQWKQSSTAQSGECTNVSSSRCGAEPGVRIGIPTARDPSPCPSQPSPSLLLPSPSTSSSRSFKHPACACIAAMCIAVAPQQFLRYRLKPPEERAARRMRSAPTRQAAWRSVLEMASRAVSPAATGGTTRAGSSARSAALKAAPSSSSSPPPPSQPIGWRDRGRQQGGGLGPGLEPCVSMSRN